MSRPLRDDEPLVKCENLLFGDSKAGDGIRVVEYYPGRLIAYHLNISEKKQSMYPLLTLNPFIQVWKNHKTI
jgi:hypothetical protein